MPQKVMKLIEPSSGLMICKVCGAWHYASIRPGSNGRFYRGSWQCRYDCKLNDLKKSEKLGQ